MFEAGLYEIYESLFLVCSGMSVADTALHPCLFCREQTHERQRRHMRVHDIVFFTLETLVQKAHALEKRKHGRKIKHSSATSNYLVVKRRRSVGVKIKLTLRHVDMPKIIHNAVDNAAGSCVADYLRYFDFSFSVVLHFIHSSRVYSAKTQTT